MRSIATTSGLLAALLTLATTTTAQAADKYTVDGAHAGAVFKVGHGGFSWIYGRFNDVSGTFAIDSQNPEASKFEIVAKTDSLDTGNAKRDGHLKSPDFFNVKQFPAVTFVSTSVSKHANGLQVVGDLTLHGVTKSVTFVLTGGKTGEFPPGVHRTGYTTELTIKRSDYGMDKMIPAAGDEVGVMLSFEGIKS